MRSFLNLGLPAVSLLMLLSVGAAAQTEIIIEPETCGTIHFSPSSGPHITPSVVRGQSNSIIGGAYPGTNAAPSGMWLTGNNPIVTTASTPNIFPVNMNGLTANFNFVVGSRAITTSISNKGAPRSSRPLTVSGSSGIFTALWKSSGIEPPGFSVSSSSHTPPIDSGSTASGAISSGGILGSSTAPEPASIALIGSGLLAIGGVLKRRLRK